MATNLAALSYTATGSSHSRTLGARAADIINVLDYGADPTGVNPSDTAFNAAIAANGRPLGPLQQAFTYPRII